MGAGVGRAFQTSKGKVCRWGFEKCHGHEDAERSRGGGRRRGRGEEGWGGNRGTQAGLRLRGITNVRLSDLDLVPPSVRGRLKIYI